MDDVLSMLFDFVTFKNVTKRNFKMQIECYQKCKVTSVMSKSPEAPIFTVFKTWQRKKLMENTNVGQQGSIFNPFMPTTAQQFHTIFDEQETAGNFK